MHFHAANGRFVINVSGLAKAWEITSPSPPCLLNPPPTSPLMKDRKQMTETICHQYGCQMPNWLR